MTCKSIILDTDIGTNVDDLLALSLVLTTPDVALDVDIVRAERLVVDRLVR